MKLVIDNIDTIDIESVKKNKDRLKSLLSDLSEINEVTGKSYYIEVNDTHNEYSPERVDPCPDDYGYFCICINNKIIGEYMSIDALDDIMFFFYELTMI